MLESILSEEFFNTQPPSSWDFDLSTYSQLPAFPVDDLLNITELPSAEPAQVHKASRAIPKVTTAITKSRANNSNAPSLNYSREQLLELSSDQLLQKVGEIEAQRPLTPKEKEQVKKYLRLIKNREAAQAHRHRKKEKFHEMEQTIHRLQQENLALKALEAENRALRQEIEMLRNQQNNQVLQYGAEEFALPCNSSDLDFSSFLDHSSPASDSSDLESLSSPMSQSNGSFWTIGSPSFDNFASTAVKGVCLLAILLSVGLLVNTFPVNGSPMEKNLMTYPLYREGRVLNPVSAKKSLASSNVVANSASGMDNHHFNPRRVTLAFDETENETKLHQETVDDFVMNIDMETDSDPKGLNHFSFNQGGKAVLLQQPSVLTLEQVLSDHVEIELYFPENTLKDFDGSMVITAQILRSQALP